MKMSKNGERNSKTLGAMHTILLKYAWQINALSGAVKVSVPPPFFL